MNEKQHHAEFQATFPSLACFVSFCIQRVEKASETSTVSLQQHSPNVSVVLLLSEAQLELHCQEVVGYSQRADVRERKERTMVMALR